MFNCNLLVRLGIMICKWYIAYGDCCNFMYWVLGISYLRQLKFSIHSAMKLNIILNGNFYIKEVVLYLKDLTVLTPLIDDKLHANEYLDIHK